MFWCPCMAINVSVQFDGDILPCSADHEQDWRAYPVDPYSCYMCDHTYIVTLLRFDTFYWVDAHQSVGLDA